MTKWCSLAKTLRTSPPECVSSSTLTTHIEHTFASPVRSDVNGIGSLLTMGHPRRTDHCAHRSVYINLASHNRAALSLANHLAVPPTATGRHDAPCLVALSRVCASSLVAQPCLAVNSRQCFGPCRQWRNISPPCTPRKRKSARAKCCRHDTGQHFVLMPFLL